MTLGVSLLLVAAGAILIWGVTGEASGIDVDAIGVILIVVGIVGFILSLVFWDRWGAGMPWGGARRLTRVDGPPVRRTVATPARTTVVEEEVEDYPAGPPAAGPPPP
jgi:hypothetical protein